jgi:hypothetical protein
MDNLNKNNKYEWFASGNAPLLFPAELVMGDFLFEDLSTMKIPVSLPFAATWGKPVSTHLSSEKYHPAPKFILISWLSLVEKKFYAVVDGLPKEKIDELLSEKNDKTKQPKYDTLVAGMAPHGNLAIWLSGNGITTEVAWMQGKEVPVEMKDFAPNSKLSKEEYAEKALAECKEAHKNVQNNGLPNPTLFKQYMQKFNYRITPKFENAATLEKIECFYYNGELNTTNSGEHAENAMRAKPHKIALHWRTGKIQYSGYFWTDETKIIETFAKFYDNDTQKEGELLIEVGKSNKDFKFSLQDKSTVIEIPVEEIEIIVFKNKFEFFKSKNYSKPPQGWRN